MENPERIYRLETATSSSTLSRTMSCHMYRTRCSRSCLCGAAARLSSATPTAASLLYTRCLPEPSSLIFYIAASPTTWWSDNVLVKNQEAELHRRKDGVDPAPSLFLTWGDCNDELDKRSGESDESFQRRKAIAEGREMRESVASLVGRLQDCPSVRDIWTCHFPGEDHCSAAVVGLQRGIMKFLVDMSQ